MVIHNNFKRKISTMKPVAYFIDKVEEMYLFNFVLLVITKICNLKIHCEQKTTYKIKIY